MRCPICSTNRSTVGVLCEECSDELAGPVTIVAEQLIGNGDPHAEQTAALIDVWGRPHRIGSPASIGRATTAALGILDGNVSRRHASITYEGDQWIIGDLGSANGTVVNGRVTRGDVALADGDQIEFGPFRFFFVVDASRLPVARNLWPASKTERSFDRATTSPFVARESPPSRVRIVFHQPTGGGGGMIEIDGKLIQLTLPQFELVKILMDRMLADQYSAAEHRGFVDATTLLARLSLDSPEPNEDHLRQLVRRVRRALTKAHVPELIESKRGHGYRLGATSEIEVK